MSFLTARRVRPLANFVGIQAADPNWRSVNIENPSLISHIDNPDIRPLAYDSSRNYITSFDPATGLHLTTTLADNEKDIANKIALATRAQQGTPAEPGIPRRPGWRETNFAQRRKVIRSLKKWLVEHQDTCARVACRDTGKTCAFHFFSLSIIPFKKNLVSAVVDAALGEILTTCSKMDWLLKHGQRALRPEKRSTNFILSYKSAKVHYEPLGVVAAIVSWNYRSSTLFSFPRIIFKSL